jgi:hypothetical protein
LRGKTTYDALAQLTWNWLSIVFFGQQSAWGLYRSIGEK